MTDLSYGLYILQVYANQGGLSPPGVIASYRRRYMGDGAVASLGKLARGLSVGALSPKLRSLAEKEGEDVSRASLNDILLKLGGKSESTISIVGDGLKGAAEELGDLGGKVASGALSGLKYLAIIAVVGGIIYLGVQTGAFRALKK